jgi:hypothetical protein
MPKPVRFVSVLVLCMLMLRALIPVGFMPRADDLRQGRFVMTICQGAGGMKTIVVDADGNPVDAGTSGDHDDPSLHIELCAFSVLGSLIALPFFLTLLVLALLAVARRFELPRSTVLNALPLHGPPLGSRAPPFFLAI